MIFKKTVFILAITCSIIGLSSSIPATADQTLLNLHIPTISEVLDTGYPTNDLGETYGPALSDDNAIEPDLLLAYGDNGVLGYVRQAEMDHEPKTPEEALAWMNSHRPKTFNLYSQDGVTIIGTFTLTTNGQSIIK